MQNLQRLVRSAVAATIAMLLVACSSAPSSVKQLDESNARRMVADYLTTTNPDLGLLIGSLLPLVDSRRTSDDYTKGTGVYDAVLARLIQQGLIAQRPEAVVCPEISGTFVNSYNKGSGITETDTWMLRPIPGTNDLQGQCIWSTNPNPAYCCTWKGTARGTVESDGKVRISCSLTQGVDKTQSAVYVEEGPTASLNVTDIGAMQPRTFTGPATRRRLTATRYDYEVSTAFRALIKDSPGGPYVDVGKFEIENVTTLRLETDTKASANFHYRVSLNSIGRLFYPTTGVDGTGQVVFGKKPDQTWVVDSVTGVPRFRQVRAVSGTRD